MIMAYQKNLAASILFAILLLAITSTVSLIGTAFASTENATTMSDGTSVTGNTGETAPSTPANASKMNGVIASMQLDENGNPAWITSGHWNLESDVPLIGGDVETEPQVSNFSATLYMVSNADGTALHPHEVSDFVQTAVLHEGPNSTTVNGTFTITLQEGPVENVNGYVHIINDKIEFWVDPVATDNHFGPTTITGIVTPERFGGMKGGGAHEGMMMTTTTNTVQQ
ncbi:MAG: hypothetical protein M3114_05620 [Thermoproteota archaeon]|nr:hypothetical protein [Thermoproteota archaeon]